MVFLGVCILLPYNCLLVSQPYLDQHIFKGMEFPFTSTFAYSIVLCCTQIFLTFRGELISANVRLGVALVSNTLMCAAMAVLTLVVAHGSMPVYAACLFLVALCSFSNALLQSGLFGIAVAIGQELSGGLMMGLGLAGLASLAISLAARALVRLPGSEASEAEQGAIVTAVLFFVCVVQDLTSAWVFFDYLSVRLEHTAAALADLEDRRPSRSPSQNSMRSPRSARGSPQHGSPRHGSSQHGSPQSDIAPVHNLRFAAFATEGKPARDLIPSETDLTMVESSGVPSENSSTGVSFAVEGVDMYKRALLVLREIAPQAANVWFVFVVTMCVFPGIVTAWVPGPTSIFHGDRELFNTLVIGCFQVFDVVGRMVAPRVARRLPPSWLWMLVVLRVIFVPLFILGQRCPSLSPLWGSDVGRFGLCAALATSNGVLASCGMEFGPARCDGESREAAGMAMSCSMVLGIFAGTLLAFLTQL